jgi:hypothetical protein
MLSGWEALLARIGADVVAHSKTSSAEAATNTTSSGRHAHNLELVCVPFSAGWLNHIEPQFAGLRHFALGAADHQGHGEQGARSAATSPGASASPRPPPTQARRPDERCLTRH